MKNIASTLRWAAVLAVGLVPVASAEVISTTDGDITVTESVAPLGTPLTYVSGGGLTGIADCWGAPLTPPCSMNSPAVAAGAADHNWVQYLTTDPNGASAIRWTTGGAGLSEVVAVPGVDHGPNPGENLEFIIWGSNDGTTWTPGKITAIYRDGFDTDDTILGHSDDYASLWSFTTTYTFFAATGGSHLSVPCGAGCGDVFEGEIDALVAPVPEPGTFVLVGLGLAGLALSRRRR